MLGELIGQAKTSQEEINDGLQVFKIFNKKTPTCKG